MEDHRLGNLLRELPREQARPGFTARVLNRLETNRMETPERRRALIPKFALSAALAIFLVILSGVLVNARRDAAATAQAQEQALAEIRADHARLEREVQELSQQPSVVYLGGNENVDLVLDLGKTGGTEGAKPAVYRSETHGETF
jgi:cell division protein FtsB